VDVSAQTTRANFDGVLLTIRSSESFFEVTQAIGRSYIDFSMNNWIRRLPPEMVTSHLNLDEVPIKKIPAENQAVIAGQFFTLSRC
jgi:hypothetical protein